MVLIGGAAGFKRDPVMACRSQTASEALCTAGGKVIVVHEGLAKKMSTMIVEMKSAFSALRM